jgi:acetyl esterase/lipase
MRYTPNRSLWIASSLLLAGECLGPSPAFSQQAHGPKVPDNVRYEPDRVYRTVGKTQLHCNLARPTRGKGPFPGVIILNGGCWQDLQGNRSFCTPLLLQLAQNGFVAIAISHRKANTHPFPAQVHDAKAAVRWLRDQAGALDLNPNQIAVVGFSSGGHLALLLGSTTPADGLEEPNADLRTSGKVQAVVACYAPTDLARLRQDAREKRLCLTANLIALTVLNQLVPDEKDLVRASPISYVRPQSAPLLLIHGTEDRYVPFDQSEVYARKLTEAGGRVRLLKIKSDHAFGCGWGGEAGKESDDATLKFLTQQFNPRLAGK